MTLAPSRPGARSGLQRGDQSRWNSSSMRSETALKVETEAWGFAFAALGACGLLMIGIDLLR